ncbi:MAG: Uma2 family endonuclease [Leptolyngbyaceae cyanobacterium T60_A2020_046]|nr:Uma2 family endonuclease [Leptolyngbyaceae cyanobacterium T60_A2020_046]
MQLYEALKTVISMRQIRLQGIAIATPGQPKNRYPDLTVLRPDHPDQMRSLGQAAITLDIAPPLLVVEMVSPGADNHRRDYIDTRNQYEGRGIPEDWIVDPERSQVTVLSLRAQGYAEQVFQGDAPLQSPTFPTLTLTAAAILG